MADVSILIPSDGRPSLAATLRSLLANRTGAEYEILVAGVADPAAGPNDPRIRYLPLTGLGTGALRNRAAAAATGTKLLFIDSDCVADPDWIERARAAVSPQRPIVGGGIRFPENNPWDLGDNLAIFSPLHVSRPAYPVTGYLGTNNLAVWRPAFESVRGFRDDLTVGEDWDFLNRARAAGHAVWFDPGFAVLHNSGRATAARVREHARWYAQGYRRLLRERVVAAGRWRAERLIARIPPLAALWSAARATAMTAGVLLPHPPFWKYLRAAPAVWLFYYTRRRELLRAG